MTAHETMLAINAQVNAASCSAESRDESHPRELRVRFQHLAHYWNELALSHLNANA